MAGELRAAASAPATDCRAAVTGLLKGFDGLVNLVLDECVEYFEGAGSRTLGLVVCRGPNVTTICPEDSLVEIENPFVAAESGAE